jgi:hypothetical protein
MYLVDIFLPLDDPEGRPWDGRLFDDLRRELVERFGGATIYSRAPAQGLWKDDQAKVRTDRIVIVEVMVPALESAWWTSLRLRLQETFRQESVLIQACRIEVL